MADLNITVSNSNENTAYTFIARGTEYTIIANLQGLYDIWTQRLSLSRQSGSIKVMNLQEMANSNQTLKSFTE